MFPQKTQRTQLSKISDYSTEALWTDRNSYKNKIKTIEEKIIERFESVNKTIKSKNKY